MNKYVASCEKEKDSEKKVPRSVSFNMEVGGWTQDYHRGSSFPAISLTNTPPLAEEDWELSC